MVESIAASGVGAVSAPGGYDMGFFDKLKQMVSGAAGTAVQTAVESAKEAATNSVTSGISGAAEGVVGGALSHVPGGSIVTDALQSGANAGIEGGVDQAAEAITAKVAEGHGQQ